jgi:hypothetical protein
MASYSMWHYFAPPEIRLGVRSARHGASHRKSSGQRNRRTALHRDITHGGVGVPVSVDADHAGDADLGCSIDFHALRCRVTALMGGQ